MLLTGKPSLHALRFVAKKLGLPIRVSPDDVVNFANFVGERYGIPNEAGNEAVKLFAQAEGIILDPVYTGKAAAGMIALAVPADLPRRDDILISAFAVVAFSVIVQGLTAPLALKALRLTPSRREQTVAKNAPGRAH